MTYSYRPSTSLTTIDASPLAARYHVLMTLIHSFITAKRYRDVERLSHRVVRLVEAYVKVGTYNALVSRKLDMLADPNWRGRVLKDLGGLRKLKLWDSAFSRAMMRAQGLLPTRKRKPVARDDEPAWLRTPERLAESERLKARKRAILKGNMNSKTNRDRYKVDMDGLFRLAPLPRQASITPRKVTIYTKATISDYDFDPMPYYQPKGFPAAPVWPVEFYAAMALDKDMNAEAEGSPTLSSVIPDWCSLAKQNRRDLGPNHIDRSLQIDPGSTAHDNIIALGREDKIMDGPANDNLPLMKFIGAKNYNYIFENPV